MTAIAATRLRRIAPHATVRSTVRTSIELWLPAGVAVAVALAGCDRDPPPAPSPRPPDDRPADRARRDDWLAGFAAGASREALRRACEAAGHRFDDYDWDDEHPRAPEWVASGRMSRCSGGVGRLPWGEVVEANFALHDDHLTGITFFLSGDEAAVRAALASRFHESIAGPGGRRVWLIDREGRGFEPMSVSVGPAPTSVQGADFSLTVTSRAGVEAPPMPGQAEVAEQVLRRE